MKDIDDKSFMRGLYIGSIVTLVVTLIVISISGHRDFLSRKDINHINNLYKDMQSSFYKDVDKDEVLDSVYHGMLSSLDKYSAYYNEDEYTKLKTADDDFSGIGVLTTQRTYDGRLVITEVYKNSPAEIAGLKAKDVIIQVDNKIVTNMPLEDVTDLIRGKKGTKVNIEVIRGNNTLKFDVVRDDVTPTQIYSEKLNADTGYVKLRSFEGNLAEDFEKVLKTYKDTGIKNIVIDLRGNGGGYLDVCIACLNKIAPNNMLITYTLNKHNDRKEYKTESNLTDLEFKYVILTDENTASCSEIFTSMFKSYHWATIIGEKTYGKGVVQTLTEAKVDGKDIAYKITTDRYYTPDNECIDAQGIEPDIQMQNPDEEPENILDDDLVKKAIQIF